MLFTVHDLYHFLCLKRIRKYEVERTGNTDTTKVEFLAAREAYAMLYSKPSIALGSWPEDCNVFVCGVRATSRAISTLKTGTLLAMLKTGTFTGGAEDRHFYWWCWRPALLPVMLKTGTFTGGAELRETMTTIQVCTLYYLHRDFSP